MNRALPERIFAAWDDLEELADDGFLHAVVERPEKWFCAPGGDPTKQRVGVYRLVDIIEVKDGTVITSGSVQ